MSDILILKIQKLVDNEIGDTSRLLHIKEVIENGKIFYNSDKKYLDNLILKYIDTTYESKKIIQIQQQKQEKQFVHEMEKKYSESTPVKSEEDTTFVEPIRQDESDVSIPSDDVKVKNQKQETIEIAKNQSDGSNQGKRFAILQLKFGLWVVAGSILITFGLFLLATTISLDLWMVSIFVSTSSAETSVENFEQIQKRSLDAVTPFIIISIGCLVVGVLTILIGYYAAKIRIEKYEE